MKKFLALGVALLAVSACGDTGGGNATNASGNEAGAAEGNESAEAAAGPGAAAAPAPTAGGANETIEPGLWEITAQMSMTGPGIPEGAGNQTRTERDCITPEDTREMADSFAEVPEGVQCSERRFTMRGGNMEGVLACRGQGADFRMRMSGTYTGTTFNFRQEASGRMPGAPQPMDMRGQMTGRRIAAQCSEEDEQRSGNRGGER